MKTATLCALYCLASSLLHLAWAIPFPTGPIMDIRGKVVDWVWRGEAEFSQEYPSGNAYEGLVPAHYLVIIRVDGLDEEALGYLSSVARSTDCHTRFMDNELAKDEVLVMLPSDRVKEMALDAEIEIKDYQIGGDERGPDPAFTKMTINGKEGTPEGELFPNLRRDKEKPAGKRDFGRVPDADCPITAEQADKLLGAALSTENEWTLKNFFAEREDISMNPMQEALWDAERKVWFRRVFWGSFGFVEASIGENPWGEWDGSLVTIHYAIDRSYRTVAPNNSGVDSEIGDAEKSRTPEK